MIEKCFSPLLAIDYNCLAMCPEAGCLKTEVKKGGV